MKYAIVKINGSQYKLSEGDEISVSKLPFKEGEEIKFDEVLLVAEGEKIKIGKPYLKDIKISAKIIKQFLGDKLDIFKFKAKTGYRRKMGFRPKRTLLKISKIE